MLKSLLVCTALVCFAMASSTHAEEGPPPSDQAKRVEDLVNRAAALVDQRGRGAFDEFLCVRDQCQFGLCISPSRAGCDRALGAATMFVQPCVAEVAADEIIEWVEPMSVAPSCRCGICAPLGRTVVFRSERE